jgi:hypothetical protein
VSAHNCLAEISPSISGWAFSFYRRLQRDSARGRPFRPDHHAISRSQEGLGEGQTGQEQQYVTREELAEIGNQVRGIQGVVDRHSSRFDKYLTDQQGQVHSARVNQALEGLEPDRAAELRLLMQPQPDQAEGPQAGPPSEAAAKFVKDAGVDPYDTRIDYSVLNAESEYARVDGLMRQINQIRQAPAQAPQQAPQPQPQVTPPRPSDSPGGVGTGGGFSSQEEVDEAYATDRIDTEAWRKEREKYQR